MINKVNNWENIVASGGDFETLAPGGYICKILDVIFESKSYGGLLRISFDIAEGENQGFYLKRYKELKASNPEAKWTGMLYQTIINDKPQFFKGFITAIENSNNGYKWNWDEQSLKNLLFGGLFGEEEYYGNDGKVKTSVKCMQVRSVDKIRSNEFKIPEKKIVQPIVCNNIIGENTIDDSPF